MNEDKIEEGTIWMPTDGSPAKRYENGKWVDLFASLQPKPEDWRAYTLRSWKEALEPAIKVLGEQEVLGPIGNAIFQAAKFHNIEMRFNDDLRAIQVRRPEKKFDTIRHPIESLDAFDKQRLGDIISWILHGPEQGFCNNDQLREMKNELAEFCKLNNIPVSDR